MKKRILAILLCICMLLPHAVFSAADDEVPGDANGDGRVSVSDVSLMLRVLVGLDYRMDWRNRMYCDVNRNFTLDAEDAAIVLRYVAGLVPNLQGPVKLDQTLYQNLLKQTMYIDEFTEWIARYIQTVPSNDAKKVMYAAAKYMSTSYSELDCSAYLKAAFADAGISKDVYPQKSSDGTLKWYQDTTYPERQKYLHKTDDASWKSWKPGSVLIYVNVSTGKGSHLALYIGEIEGEPIVMESRRYMVDGVRVGPLMFSSDSWDLQYYVDPLG